MIDEIVKSLNNKEYEFIYDALGIQNSGENSQSGLRFWFEDFRNNFNKRAGDVYEFGVYKGSSLISIALLAKRIGSDKHFWGFDSFKGFPSYSPEDELDKFREDNGFSKELINSHKLLLKLRSSNINLNNEALDLKSKLKNLGRAGLFEDASYDSLQKKIELFRLDNITLIPGDFKDTVPTHFKNIKQTIFSANIDCDLYEGYKISLPLIFKHLEIGGYIHLDEYYSLKYPGPKIATDKFLLKSKNAVLQKNETRDGEFERYFITKIQK